ncbi:hypothetical protein CF319_g8034 [Tilletia indica]|nr:hypothetical protein CF319_g8034 [Tilletia indica]
MSCLISDSTQAPECLKPLNTFLFHCYHEHLRNTHSDPSFFVPTSPFTSSPIPFSDLSNDATRLHTPLVITFSSLLFTSSTDPSVKVPHFLTQHDTVCDSSPFLPIAYLPAFTSTLSPLCSFPARLIASRGALCSPIRPGMPHPRPSSTSIPAPSTSDMHRPSLSPCQAAKQPRPRSRNLTALYEAILAAVVYHTDITDNWTRVAIDGSMVIKSSTLRTLLLILPTSGLHGVTDVLPSATLPGVILPTSGLPGVTDILPTWGLPAVTDIIRTVLPSVTLLGGVLPTTGLPGFADILPGTGLPGVTDIVPTGLLGLTDILPTTGLPGLTSFLPMATLPGFTDVTLLAHCLQAAVSCQLTSD